MKSEAAVPESSIVKFRDSALERLYQTYNLKQKRASVECFLFACALYDVYALISEDRLHWPMLVFLFSNCCLWAWCKWSPRPLWRLIPIVVSQISSLQLIWRLIFNELPISGNDDLGWVVLFDFLLFVTLPLSWIWSILFSLVLCTEYLAVTWYLASQNADFYSKVNMRVLIVLQYSCPQFVLYINY